MHPRYKPAACRRFALCLFLIAGNASAWSQVPAANPSAVSTIEDKAHQPPVSAKINALAHKVLAAGLKLNALTGAELKPWHMKVDYTMDETGSGKPFSGSFEESYSGPDLWTRSFSSSIPRANGTTWSTSKLEQFMKLPREEGYAFHALDLRIARPVVNPLYQAANMKPEYDMQIERVNTAGILLNCVSVVNAAQYAPDTNPDWLFPTMCFDTDLHLRLTVAGDTSVQFDDIQVFQHRAVARDVKVITQGRLLSEMKITQLDSVEGIDPEVLKPGKGALAEPFVIEPGFPGPESVFEVAASVPIGHNGLPYRGSIPVSLLIHKDGSVKVNSISTLRIGVLDQSLSDSLSAAVQRWKFKPYLVDGEPAEVAYTVIYPLDGKPFVPSYERPKPAPVVTDPNDYSSTWDYKRDPEKDLQMAMADAAKTHKRILLDAGGAWCIWCVILDKAITDHADLKDFRDKNYQVLKVYYGPRTENTAFFAHYPRIPGYPWLFVLDVDGKLLVSKNTEELEDRTGSYSVKGLLAFLNTWKP